MTMVPLAHMLQALADGAPDALLAVDERGRIRYANLATANLFNYTADELVGKPIETLIPTRFRQRHRADRRRYIANPRSRPMGLNMELTGLRRDGTEVPVEVSLSPLHEGGEHLVIAAVRDVTELKRSRELLQRSQRQAALAALSEDAVSAPSVEMFCRRIQATLTAQLALSHVGVCERTHEGRHIRFVCMAGWDDSDHALDTIHGVMGSARLERILEGQVQEVLVAPGARARQQPDDYLVGMILPLRGPSKVHGLLSLFRPASKPLSEDERLFAQSAGHLLAAVFERQHHHGLLLQASKMEALGQLTGGVAHDFNNLLTVISGNLQILEDCVGGQAEAQALLDSAARAARRGAELTQKLLAFSRKRPIAAQAVDCAAAISAMRDMLRRTLGEGIELRYRIDPKLPSALADPAQFESAILNLALNARDAMPGGGTLTLSAHWRRGHDAHGPTESLVVEVSDTGEGMSREVAQRAIEPFYTTKAPGKGTGLGLSMVYGFVRQWGGDVRIYSEPGVGTTVRLLLPIAPGQEARGPHEPMRGIRGSEHLLVVEDDREVARIARMQLTSLGYRVSEADGIEGALAHLRRHADIALVFTDVVLLGGETGFLLADRIRVEGHTQPVLYASGYAEAALERHYGADQQPRVLGKPYTREDLGIAIRELLEGS
jgi:PAS domain S-box-containing protein